MLMSLQIVASSESEKSTFVELRKSLDTASSVTYAILTTVILGSFPVNAFIFSSSSFVCPRSLSLSLPPVVLFPQMLLLMPWALGSPYQISLDVHLLCDH